MLKKVAIAAAIVAGSLVAAVPSAALANTPAAAVTAAATPLIKAQDLKNLVGQPDVRILDIRAEKDYAAGHIPGAISTPYAQYRGPQDNPGALQSEAKLTDVLRKAGIDAGSRVVVVHAGSDHTDFGAAARVYWTLKAGGVSRLSIADGGTAAWKAAGGALETTAPNVTPSQFSFRYDKSMIATKDEIAAALQAGKAPVLLDARPASFFKGEQRADASARYGTLPGARALDNAGFFTKGDVTLKPEAELRSLVQQAGVDSTPTVSFCNTGHWAATNWFVLSEIAGNKNVKLYPESVVEWSKTDLPMDNQPSRITALLQDAKRSLAK
ncbi:sulfurtransferase [Thauera sp. 2A1]|uniref:sulfurtransferase n=1 Tax=Thauera sp. 2A1 TaxID=2570191 RepID=UPI0012927D12|nr:rhodanese-like domain-containing protein [Thauera sp. 2A1]KAI5916394.1 rhodanese-like domain-containing protein [Thauera sp. 2A1]